MDFQNCAVFGNQHYADTRYLPTRCYRNAAPVNSRKTSETKGNMKLDTLEKLYISELRDLYSAENQLLKALPKMAKGASSPELKDAFEQHLEQTKGHVERLEQLFEQLD